MHVVVRPGRPTGGHPDLRRRIIVRFMPGQAPDGAALRDGGPARGTRPGWSRRANFLRLHSLHLDSSLPAAITQALPALLQRARALDPTWRDPDFSRFYSVTLPPGVPSADALGHLREMDGVQYAYLESGWTPRPDFDPSDDTYMKKQKYLEPHTATAGGTCGIGVKAVWDLPGGRGEGLTLADVESGWKTSHPDLARGGASVVEELDPAAHGDDPEHGVNVLGILSAQDNTLGLVGIASEAGVLASNLYVDAAGIVLNRAAAILRPLPRLLPGDVLLVEDQVDSEEFGYSNLPVEVEPLNYYAIRLATALGVVVVEAAGNSSLPAAVGGTAQPYDLDAFLWKDSATDPGRKVLLPGSPDYRDSGAILVSAGTSWYPHEVSVPTCVGSRVNCFAWGTSVETLSAGNGDEVNAAGVRDPDYLKGFNGTSAASAIVAGAALVVQGLVKASGWPPLTSMQMRGVLGSESFNTRSRNGKAVDKMGVMPNLERISGEPLVQRVELYVRDYVGDLGAVPSAGTLSTSPDIIVRGAAVADPQAEFGEGSGTENDAYLSEDPLTGADSFVYVRVRNRGAVDAPNVGVKVFWAPPSSLVTPELWTEVGSTTIPLVPKGDVLTVSPAITWSLASGAAGPQVAGHYCLVALVGNDDDPSPEPDRTDDPAGSNPAFRDFDEYMRFIRDNNNAAWRNVDVVTMASGTPVQVARTFHVVGPPDRAREMELVFEVRMPRRTLVGVRPDPEGNVKHPELSRRLFASRFGAAGMVPLAGGRTRLGPWPFPAGLRLKCELVVDRVELRKGESGTITLRQYHEGQVVGALTWHFVGGG